MVESNVTVRDARLEETEILARFNEAMALESEGVRLDPATIRAGVRAVLADPGKGRYFLAETGGEVAGALLITYEWSDWRNACFIWLQSVYVAPAHRRRGVFRSLFHHIEKIASGLGYCGLRLYMDRDNSGAWKTYEKLGMSHRSYIVFETPDRLRREE
jgi:GNAT superfamily N-acetyltransferase